MKWSHQGRKGTGPAAGRKVKRGRNSTRNWVTWRGALLIPLWSRSVGCVGQLKRWATVWSVAWQSGQVGLSAQPTEWR